MPIRQFDIYDIVVDVVPGVILIFSLLYLPATNSISNELPGYDLGGGVAAALLLILGFVTGHLIQVIVRSSFFTKISKAYDYIPRMPEYRTKSFQQTIEEFLNDDTQIGRKFLRGCEEFFDLKLIECGDTNTEIYEENLDMLFFLVRNYVIGNNIGRSRRYLIGRVFFRSLWGVFLIVFLLYGVYAVSIVVVCSIRPTGCPGFLQRFLIYLFIALISLFASILSQYRFRIYTDTYGKELFNDFYGNVLRDG